jgi:hypothetical protein
MTPAEETRLPSFSAPLPPSVKAGEVASEACSGNMTPADERRLCHGCYAPVPPSVEAGRMMSEAR